MVTDKDRVRILSEHIQSASAAIVELTEQKNGAYRERDILVAALSKCFPSHLTRHVPQPREDWDDEWLNVVCVHLPAGQATWHIHSSELGLFEHLNGIEPRCQGYDGYTTDEKYRRVFSLEKQW